MRTREIDKLRPLVASFIEAAKQAKFFEGRANALGTEIKALCQRFGVTPGPLVELDGPAGGVTLVEQAVVKWDALALIRTLEKIGEEPWEPYVEYEVKASMKKEVLPDLLEILIERGLIGKEEMDEIVHVDKKILRLLPIYHNRSEPPPPFAETGEDR